MARHRPGEFPWDGFFRGFGGRIGLKRHAPTPAAIDDLDLWTAHRGDLPSTPLSLLITEIERDALAVYADHGLPTRPGHYVRAPDEDDWQFVAERLTPEERWALLDEYPPGQGWRFTTLEDLGRYADLGERVIEAARMLHECRFLRDMPMAGTEAETLERALRLGVAWRGLKPDLAWQAVEPVEIAKPRRIPRSKVLD